MPGEVEAVNRRQERVIYWLGENRKNLSLTVCYLQAIEVTLLLTSQQETP